MAKQYNGHKSWAYWNVSLWLFNDEGLYNMVRSKVRSSRTKDVAAQRIVQELNDCGLTQTPDGARYSVSAVRAAIAGEV